MKTFRQRREDAKKEEEHYLNLRDNHEFTKDEIHFFIKMGVGIISIVLIICVSLIVLVSKI